RTPRAARPWPLELAKSSGGERWVSSSAWGARMQHLGWSIRACRGVSDEVKASVRWETTWAGGAQIPLPEVSPRLLSLLAMVDGCTRTLYGLPQCQPSRKGKGKTGSALPHISEATWLRKSTVV